MHSPETFPLSEAKRPRLDTDPQYHFELACKLAEDNDNLLLVNQTIALAQAYGLTHHELYQQAYADLIDQQASLEAAWRTGDHARWIDVPLAGEAQLSPQELASAKLDRTIGWLEGLRNGEGMLVCVAAPAYNEQDNITGFIDSLTDVPLEYPLVIIGIADNNSEDATPVLAMSRQATVFHAPDRGIGPSRQVALDGVNRLIDYPSPNVIILTTDADTRAAPGITDAIARHFERNDQLLVANGTVRYVFDWPDLPVVPDDTYGQADIDFINRYRVAGSTQLVVDDFAGYAYFTGTHSVRDCISLLGYDPADILPGQRFWMQPGPFTAFRKSFPEQFGLRYTTGRGWEQHQWSFDTYRAAAEQGIEVDDIIDHLAGDGIWINASARALTGADDPAVPYSRQRWQYLREHGLEPFKAVTGDNTELTNIGQMLDDMVRAAHGRPETDMPLGYFEPENVVAALHAAQESGRYGRIESLPAVSPTTGRQLGKVAMFGVM